MSKVVGVDLGTGNSCISILEGGEARVIANAEGARTTPSIVAWTKDGECLVGQAAKRQAVTNPKNTVYEIKRLIGRKYAEVKDELKYLSYDVIEAANGDCRVKINDKEYSPEEISSFILKKLKKDVESYLGEDVNEAVITVPAYFNDSQRSSTKLAGELAGLKVLRIINEPTAAALSYGCNKKKSGFIAVADSGSGTLDFSILEVGDGVFEVKSTAGNSQLGGKDYDQAIMQWLIDEFKTDTGIDLSKDNMAIQRLKDESEKAKIALSTTESVEINLPFISADATGPKHLIKTLSRVKFEALISYLNDKYDEPAKQCIKDSGVDKIDEVILVGGTTRMPSVQQKIKDIFGIEPSKGVNPDECVSLGASIQGGVIKGDVRDVLLLDVTPLTLAIETMGDIATPMIPRNTTIPTKKSNIFSTAVDNQPAITVRICQGERKMFSDNKLLGAFNLDGLVPAPRGVPQIEITLDMDANGILNVSAKDLGTGKEQHITITSSSGLSAEEIERAKKDAEAHEAEDAKRAELVNTKNAADGLCFAIEKALKDAGDKLTDDDKKPVLEAIENVKNALKGSSIDEIKSKVDALNKANEPIAKKLYPSSSTNGGNQQFSEDQLKEMMKDPKFASMFGNGGPFASSPNAKKDDNVVDAEVVD